MKIGIIGFPQTGKKTLFRLLCGGGGASAEQGDFGKAIVGFADIKDGRFDKLVKMYSPKKEARARIDIALLPTIEKESISTGKIFSDILDVDALCHIVRAFRDDAVYHVEGSVDPKRDIGLVNSELILHDMVFIEKRIEKIELDIKKRKKDDSLDKERALFLRLKERINKEIPLRLMDFSEEEGKLLKNYPLITLKEFLIVLNVSDKDLKDDTLLEGIKKHCAASKIDAIQISAKAEEEIAELDTQEERDEFLRELSIKEPALNMLTGLCLKTLGLISFFTTGPDEVRQWLLKRSSSAPRAAGVIHSDLERGFIRAEVVKYKDLMELGGEEGVRKAGKFYIKGKDYIVEDGDILNIRFNV